MSGSMTACLPKDVQKLVIEAAFCAVNHGLRPEILDILPVLSDWVDEPELRTACEATLLFGLGRRKAARRCLASLPADACLPLRALLAPDQPA